MTVEASTPIAPLTPAPTTAGLSGPVSAVAGALRGAAQATGASFDYLLTTAKAESDLDPNLSMRSSSATGLFQFIEQTWLSVVKQAGKALGFGGYADSIQQTPSGRYEVKDPAVRQEIMKLRKDPAANAVMAGAFTQQNAAVLANRIGRKPSDGELYMAHFLGPGGASKLIRKAGENPTANAANLFPAAAGANRPIFYDQQGSARSVAGVYGELTRRYQVARASPMPGMAAAFGARTDPVAPTAQGLPVQDTAGVTQALAVANGPLAGSADATTPVFHSLFWSDDRRGALAPVVSQLWGAQGAGAPAQQMEAVPAAPPNASSIGTPLNLFQDMRPNVRGLFDGSS
jgi:hypothetical protein